MLIKMEMKSKHLHYLKDYILPRTTNTLSCLSLKWQAHFIHFQENFFQITRNLIVKLCVMKKDPSHQVSGYKVLFLKTTVSLGSQKIKWCRVLILSPGFKSTSSRLNFVLCCFTKGPLKLSCYLLTVKAAGQSLHSRMTASHHWCEWQQTDKGKSCQDSLKTSFGLAGLSGRPAAGQRKVLGFHKLEWLPLVILACTGNWNWVSSVSQGTHTYRQGQWCILQNSFYIRKFSILSNIGKLFKWIHVI